MLCSSSFCCIFICTNPKQTLLMSARSSFHWGMSTFFGDTFDVLCFHMYKLQAYFENMSVLRILLEKAMPWPHPRSAVFSYVTNPNQNLNSRQRRKIYSCRAQKKKLIELSFKKSCRHLLAWSGPIDLRFEQGLLEVCTYEKPACQSFATWSVPAIVNWLIGRVFRICSRFVHMKT